MSQKFEGYKSMRNQPKGRRELIVIRREKVIEQRTRGMPMSQIAEQLGCSTQTVSNDLRFMLGELVKLTADQVAEHRQLELERLDALWAAIYPDAIKGNLWKIDRCLAIMERRAKLLGLDKPLQHILAGDKNNKIEIEHRYGIDEKLLNHMKKLAEGD